MGCITLTLKRISEWEWQIFAPKGHPISEIYRGNSFAAKEWALAWISGFHNWNLKIERD